MPLLVDAWLVFDYHLLVIEMPRLVRAPAAGGKIARPSL